ncbi:hypothetical protein PHLGIDRAFT_126241 [Phlebiopsis gigantea 11061_1 CR5-6]|uniref:Uncharacterized protein n=1 Tax=Phlebiopsis gigantea (strain 11061_1 CR5-6) TaxID=745531 RepID=A0A0C3NVS0_PHLG1|nr:hypothetical protein PHLGIDRAFT_126241 [Phlebiopsis gigantea 11061_1 CR5-6]
MSFASYSAPLIIVASGGILLFNALSRCSHLQTLAFINTNYMNHPPCAEPSYPDGLFSQLENLEIGLGFARFQGDTLRNLLSTVSRSQREKHPPPVPRPSRLKRLTITLWEIDDTLFEAYGNFLKDAGEFLEELVLDFSARYWNDGDAYAAARKSVDLFNVASCLNLSMLELRLSLPGTYYNWQWLVVHATLSAIPPEHLPPTIKLCLWELYPDMDPTPLVEFDQIVGHAPRVQRVVITSSTASELLHTTVCPHFVTLTSKKRLFVE